MKSAPWKKTSASAALIIASALYVLYLNFGNPQEFSATNAVPKTADRSSPPTKAASAAPTPAPAATPVPASVPVPVQKPPGQYADGTYTGSPADAYYGSVEVQATVSGGKLADVRFLQYPDTHSTSVMINSQAMPMLQSEAIQAQNANVDIISGATDTSLAFQQSLASALAQAKN